MNPYVMVLPADKKKEFMDKAVSSILFPQLKDRIDNLLITDPKNLLNPDTHPEIVKLAFAIVKVTFETLASQQPKTYKDIGGGLRVLDKSGNDISFENPKMTAYGIEIIDSAGNKKYKYVEGKKEFLSVRWGWPPVVVAPPVESDPITITDGRYNIKFYKGFNTEVNNWWLPIIPKEWLTPVLSNDIVLPGATIVGTATWANTFDTFDILVEAVSGLNINKKIGIGRIAKNADKIDGFLDFANAIRRGDPVETLEATIKLLSDKDNWVIIANAIWGQFGPNSRAFLHAAKVLVKNIAKVLQTVDWVNHHIPFIYDLGFAPWKVEYCVEQTGGVLDECGSSVPPTASLTVSPKNPYIGDPVTFDASGSTDDRTTTLQYRFDFDGDGNWDTNWSSSPIAIYSFSTKGTYDAKVEVKDEDGMTAMANYYVTVYERGKGISVAIVIDRSGSMGGQKIEDAKTAAKTYVGYMGTADRGAVIDFDDVITITQPFTDDKTLLISAIDSLYARGSTAFYDAVYTAITETAKEDPNRRRAIIVLTDGQDNSSLYKQDIEVSKRKFQDVVDYAKQVGIPVYTIGLGSDVDATMLYNLAVSTGGIYQFAPDSSQLKSLYDTMAGIGILYPSLNKKLLRKRCQE
jgi:Mg-chelatase subunit ChlD